MSKHFAVSPSQNAPTGDMTRPAIAYLVNLYPAVSHTFIRREILALERQGFQVLRIALRSAAVVDEQDTLERERTRYVLADGLPGLISALVRCLFDRPYKLLQAGGLALRMARQSASPWPVHLAYLAEACTVVRWLAAERIQHLHAHFATNPAEIAMLVRSLGGPSYSFTAHGSDITDRPAQMGLPMTVGHAAFVVAVCAYGRSQICRWVPTSLWNRIQVVRCGLDSDYGGAVSADEPDPKSRLVCVGRLSPEKGHLVLVDAVRLLRDRDRQVEVVLVGDGPMKECIQSVVREYGLQASFTFLGSQDVAGVRQAIHQSRALVVPSLSEGLPVVIMEAMALGRPVVAPYLAGIPELVSAGTTGWLFPPGDSHALALALESCLRADLSTLRQMGAAARATVMRHHDVDTESAKLAQCFVSAARGVPNAQ